MIRQQDRTARGLRMNYLDLADLVSLKFWCAVVVNDANTSHQLSKSILC